MVVWIGLKSVFNLYSIENNKSYFIKSFPILIEGHKINHKNNCSYYVSHLYFSKWEVSYIYFFLSLKPKVSLSEMLTSAFRAKRCWHFLISARTLNTQKDFKRTLPEIFSIDKTIWKRIARRLFWGVHHLHKKTFC